MKDGEVLARLGCSATGPATACLLQARLLFLLGGFQPSTYLGLRAHGTKPGRNVRHEAVW